MRWAEVYSRRVPCLVTLLRGNKSAYSRIPSEAMHIYLKKRAINEIFPRPWGRPQAWQSVGESWSIRRQK